MPGGLLTDLYELNMAASYLRRSVTGQATFSLFIRRLPRSRGFLVTAGLADCLQFLVSTRGGGCRYAAVVASSRLTTGCFVSPVMISAPVLS